MCAINAITRTKLKQLVDKGTKETYQHFTIKIYSGILRGGGECKCDEEVEWIYIQLCALI